MPKKVSEMVEQIQTHIDDLKSDIKNEFSEDLDDDLSLDKGYFITKNKMWDGWWQKLFAQMISIKVWVIVIITTLLITGNIDSGHFATILTVVMGLKGAFAVADVWRRNGTKTTMEKV